MITPRATRLVRVPDLRTMHRVVAALVAGLDPSTARGTFVLVPSVAAAAQLARTVERLLLLGRVTGSVFEQLGCQPPPSRPVVCLPSIGPRPALLSLLRSRLEGAPPLVDDFVREALMRASADAAQAAGHRPPFAVRPGLLAAMIDFYDAVRRQRRSVDDLDRLVGGVLVGEADSDRGAARLLDQTRFLVAAFRDFEGRLSRLGAIDEHLLRDRAVAGRVSPAIAHVVVTVGDVAAEPAGLWPADFDLLTRLPGLERLDVVATDAMLSAGLFERLERRLPGIADLRVDANEPPPALLVPGGLDGRRYFLSRDREEELHTVARVVKWDAHAAPSSAAGAPPDAVALVVARPLPYLYLARHVLDGAGIPWTAIDALPLAAEPYAAFLDVVIEAVVSGFSRPAWVALLRHPLLRVPTGDGGVVTRSELRELEDALPQGEMPEAGPRVVDGQTRARSRGEQGATTDGRRAVVVAAVQRLVDTLAPLTGAQRMSAHLDAWMSLLDQFEAPPPPSPVRERHLRAHSAIRTAIRRLRDAAAAHHDPVVHVREVWAALRRWIESRTFRPRVGEAGLHVLDTAAARFADVEVAWTLGLVDGDWPEAGRRDIWYPPALLDALDWPREADRIAAARATFNDLLRLPASRIAVSSFTLEDDALVQPSVLLDELETVTLPVVVIDPHPPVRVHADEALCRPPILAGALPPGARPWLQWRLSLASMSRDRFQGFVGPHAVAVHAVTDVDTWIDCPFKYLAAHVLSLEDPDEDDEGAAARDRGILVHRTLARLFERWQAGGRGAITTVNVEAARSLLAEVTDECLAGLDATDAAIERQRLLGSAAVVGFGERVLQLEVERDVPVRERRLEQRLDGTYSFAAPDGSARVLSIRGRADRIDLLEGGGLALVDYKTGRAPEARSVQLPIYAYVAERFFERQGPGGWQAERAEYVALRGRPVVDVLGRDAGERARRLLEAQQAFVEATDGIARGEFPPRPAERRLCGWCPYATVCRKDYVSDDED